MFYVYGRHSWFRAGLAPKRIATWSFAMALLCVSAANCAAQSFEKELSTGEQPQITIKNFNGRVLVKAIEGRKEKVTVSATSPGAGVAESDLNATSSGGRVSIDVKPRREQDRIDLKVEIPERSRVKVNSENGAVDIIGNVADAEVTTNTGTIHADVPVDALKYDFMWLSSKPRFLSESELPPVKEKAGGVFQIKGRLGEKKADKEDRINLSFSTRRGIVLLN